MQVGAAMMSTQDFGAPDTLDYGSYTLSVIESPNDCTETVSSMLERRHA